MYVANGSPQTPEKYLIGKMISFDFGLIDTQAVEKNKFGHFRLLYS